MTQISNIAFHHLIFVDIETTGLIKQVQNIYPAIIELGALDSVSNEKF